MTKFLNISTDTTLGGSSASDEVVSSQKALKTYIDNNSGSYLAGTGIDITNNTISVTSPTLTNTATGTDSLTILGTANSYNYNVNIGEGSYIDNSYGVSIGNNSHNNGLAVSIGYNASGSTNSVVIGYNATQNVWQGGGGGVAVGNYSETNDSSIAIGDNAKISNHCYSSIQLGRGTNSEEGTLYVGLATGTWPGTYNNYKLLGSDGLVPVARISYDNSSITENSSNKLQVSGVVDQNAGGTVKTWTGTTASLPGTLDSNTLYNITDDTTNYLQNLLETIYPVGCLYFGTTPVCPMAALLGTWTLVGTKLVTNVDSIAGVRGNGTTLGLIGSDGQTAEGFMGGLTNINNVSAAGTVLSAFIANYGKAVGTNNGSTTNPYNTCGMGVTRDSTKSGIEATVTSSSLTINVWQRSA